MIEQVRPTELTAWFRAQGPRGVLLDVREPHEVRAASVAPSDAYELVHIPMGVLGPRLHELDPDRPVACLCHHGGRSQYVANLLAANDFTKVANVAGGIDAWSRELDPTVPRY